MSAAAAQVAVLTSHRWDDPCVQSSDNTEGRSRDVLGWVAVAVVVRVLESCSAFGQAAWSAQYPAEGPAVVVLVVGEVPEVLTFLAVAAYQTPLPSLTALPLTTPGPVSSAYV